jgi:hypothetical protein
MTGGLGGTSAGGCGGGWSRSRSCDIDYFEPLPADEEDELPAELEPAPVSVETGAGAVGVVVVEVVSVDVVSLAVDELVGEAVFAVEPGVALAPELLYDVDVPGLASFLQPARAPVASAIAAM